MIYDYKSYFVVKNISSNMFWNDDVKTWQQIHDRLDVLILSIADDQDTNDYIKSEYEAILKNINLHERENCKLFKIDVEVKITL